MPENSANHNVDMNISDKNGIVPSNFRLSDAKEHFDGDPTVSTSLISQDKNFEILGVFSPVWDETQILQAQQNLLSNSPKDILTQEEILALKTEYREMENTVNRIANEMPTLKNCVLVPDISLSQYYKLLRSQHHILKDQYFTIEENSLMEHSEEIESWSLDALQAVVYGNQIPNGTQKKSNILSSIETEQQNIQKKLTCTYAYIRDCTYKAIDNLVKENLNIEEFDLPEVLTKKLVVSSHKVPRANTRSFYFQVDIENKTTLGTVGVTNMPGRYSLRDANIGFARTGDVLDNSDFINYGIVSNLIEDWVPSRIWGLRSTVYDNNLEYFFSNDQIATERFENADIDVPQDNIVNPEKIASIFFSRQSEWKNRLSEFSNYYATSRLSTHTPWNKSTIWDLIFKSKEELEDLIENLDDAVISGINLKAIEYYMAILSLGIAGSNEGEQKYWEFRGQNRSSGSSSFVRGETEQAILNSVNAPDIKEAYDGTEPMSILSTSEFIGNVYSRTGSGSDYNEADNGGFLSKRRYVAIYKAGINILRIVRYIFHKTVQNMFTGFKDLGIIDQTVELSSFLETIRTTETLLTEIKNSLSDMPKLDKASSNLGPLPITRWRIDDNSGALIFRYGKAKPDYHEASTAINSTGDFARAYRLFKLRISQFEYPGFYKTYHTILDSTFLPPQVYTDFNHTLKGSSEYMPGQYIRKTQYEFKDPFVLSSGEFDSDTQSRYLGMLYYIPDYYYKLETWKEEINEGVDKITSLQISDELSEIIKSGIIDIKNPYTLLDNRKQLSQNLLRRFRYDEENFILKRYLEWANFEIDASFINAYSTDNYDRIVIVGSLSNSNIQFEFYDPTVVGPKTIVPSNSLTDENGWTVLNPGEGIREKLLAALFFQYGIDFSVDMFPDAISVLDPVFPEILTSGNTDNKWPWDEDGTVFEDGVPLTPTNPKYYCSSLMFPEWIKKRILSSKLFENINIYLIKMPFEPQELRIKYTGE